MTREVVGTMAPTVSSVWRSLGYSVRTTAGDAVGNADDVLHAQIFKAVANCEPGTLILATGDGNANDGKGVCIVAKGCAHHAVCVFPGLCDTRTFV